MAPIKRKGDAGAPQPSSNSRKRLRTASQSTAPKEKQPDHSHKKDKVKSAVSESKPSSGPPSSFLVNSNEPPAFPRGGASALTPVERKQIQAQATRDVLFENTKKNGPLSDSEDGSEEDFEDELPQKVKGKKVSKKQKENTKGTRTLDKSGPKIEGLSYKRLAPGSIILGQVSSISHRDISVSLPNNLTGFVPLTSISSQVTSKIESFLKEQEGNEESADDDELDLASYLRVGQYIRTYVSSTGAETAGTGAQKKHIELSLEPGLCNNGMKKSDVVVNSTLQASVRSVEDHGLIMDLGLAEGNVQGFIPAKELSNHIQLSDAKPGMVFLCQVISTDPATRTIKLSVDPKRFADTSKDFVGSAPTIDSFLPGTAVELLVSEVTATGLGGKVMGMLDVVADVVHSAACKGEMSLPDQYSLGSRIKGRLISTFPLSDEKKLGFSVMSHVLEMKTTSLEVYKNQSPDAPSISDIVPTATVVKVDPGVGIYLTLGADSHEAFAHISNLSDKKIDSISESTGPFKIGSEHKARVTAYSAIDNLFLVSLQESVLSRPFLRVEDVGVGQIVKGKIQKLLISDKGVNGLVIELSEGVTGLVPRVHMSDLELQHPEKKFREGSIVKARVLSVDVQRRQVRLTLKKSLVNSDTECWKDYADITEGHAAPGTLIKVNPHGAVVQFFSNVRGYLPVAEMSEAYIKDATQHFREGQVVTVNALHVDASAQKLTVSCRDPSLTSSEESVRKLKAGTTVTGAVFEKSEDDVLLRLEGSDAIARVELDHIADGSEKKRRAALSKIRVGQKLQDLIILEVLEKRRIVRLTNKSSLMQALRDGKLLVDYSELREGKEVTGYVLNTTTDGIFVGYAGGLTGLLPKSQIPASDAQLPDFGVARLQQLTAKVLSIDYKGAVPRFWLTKITTNPAVAKADNVRNQSALEAPVDSNVTSLDDLSVGSVTKVRIVSIKDTQINVELAKDVQGRIDVSEIFDDWKEIKDRKRPLRKFENRQVIDVRVLGAHDARNHRFLPLTHRTGKTPVFELSAKPSFVKSNSLDILTLDHVKVGSSWIAYVNNIAENYLWVNLSPNVRGRIAAMDLTDDLSLLSDLEANFPIGSALRVHVTGVDLEKNRLDLSAKPSTSRQVTIKDISKGMILPGRITKTSDRQVLVQLSDTLVGAVNLVDLADDYSKVNPLEYQKNDVVRVCLLAVDVPNKKITLSLRPSRVLSSSLPVEDPEISSIDQLNVDDVRRGFITNVTEKGIFVSLAHNVTAFIRVSNLSDQYIKDWQEHFQRDQLVKGKVIALDAANNHVQMSLKESVLSGKYQPPLTFNDLKVGQVVSGKVAKVEDFGVFIVVDNSSNVRGLCHRSEIAEQRIEDVREIFNEGDAVKAIVLKIESDKRRVSFGLKASYFEDEDMEDIDDDADSEDATDEDVGGVDIEMGESGEEGELKDAESEDEGDEDDEDDAMSDEVEESSVSSAEVATSSKQELSKGLSIGGFDWVGLDDTLGDSKDTISDTEVVAKRPKKKKRAEIAVDRTGDLDAHGPQSADDYERLLLGEPDSSLLWLQYMAFHLELGEVDQARQIAQRAVQTIGIGQDAEKLNVWVAMLNLENTYGDDDSIGETFKKACQYNDAEEIHGRLASIYIQSGKLSKADDLFQAMIKKFSQNPKTWINYATFLFDSQSDPDRGRQLLSRALQTLPKHTHIDVTSKFAALEFRSPNGDAERGRTIFEGLLDSFPKRIDLWNVLLDLELKHGGKDQVRSLFDRIFTNKLKVKQAKYFFKRWLEYEEKEGDERKMDEVKARAAEFVRQAGKA